KRLTYHKTFLSARTLFIRFYSIFKLLLIHDSYLLIMPKYYQLSKEELFQQLKTNPLGLKNKTVAALQKEYGKNVLQEANRKSRWSILLSQFMDVMILILIVAAG